jgi:hypothetical protein
MMLASFLALSLIHQDASTNELRVFRAVFEDRPRQLIIMLPTDKKAEKVGFVFHPDIGTIRKVWVGSTDYRGKVYDFSQNNSRSEGRVIWEAKSECLRLADSEPSGWKSEGVRFDNGWKFAQDGAWMESPVFRYDGLQTAYIGFDELSQKARFEISLIDSAGEVGTSFGSSMAQDSGWQWNYKKIPILAGEWRLRIRAEKASDGKSVRNLRVFGDFPAWRVSQGGEIKSADVRMNGYRINKGSVTVMSRVNGAEVSWTPSNDGSGWTESFEVKGLSGSDSLILDRGLEGGPLVLNNGKKVVNHKW